MTEKHIFNNNKSNLINLSHKNPNLCSKIQKKMKNYKMTNFNFILDDKSVEIIDNNIISEKTNSEEDKKIQELSTTENDKNRQIFIENNDNNNNHNNIYENVINISEDENSQNDNNLEIISDSQSNSNDICVNKQNENFSNSDYILKNENENENGEFFSFKDENEKGECAEPIYGGINEYCGKLSNSIKIISEEDNDNSDNNIYLGKKVKKNYEKMDFGTQTYYYDDIISNKELDRPKIIILKLIEKYSYQFIFHLFLKYCSSNIPEIEYEYDKEVDFQILQLIKELGIEKVMKIILSVGNSREEYIKYYTNENDTIEVKEDQLYDNDNDNDVSKNNNIYNLNEDNENIIENNNDIIDLSDDEEIDNKKHMKDIENNINNKDINKDNNNIININEDSDEEIEQI